MEKKEGKERRVSASFATGAIALAFLAIGYQTALFIHKAATLKLLSDVPDTVYVSVPVDGSVSGYVRNDGEAVPGGRGGSAASGRMTGGNKGNVSGHIHAQRPAAETTKRKSEVVAGLREKYVPRQYESFEFNPNTVSVSDLQRLGFSLKQAQSIDSYRRKGGRFRRKSDFAASYVVADSVYERLEPYIRIPLLDINQADSAAFDALPGIGPYFASRMVEYRERLHGYSYAEQLMDIYHFDREKFDALSDLISVGPSEEYPLWALPADSLKKHPYIGAYAASGVVLYRKNNPPSALNVDGLAKAGVLKAEMAAKLAKCRIARP